MTPEQEDELLSTLSEIKDLIKAIYDNLGDIQRDAHHISVDTAGISQKVK